MDLNISRYMFCQKCHNSWRKKIDQPRVCPECTSHNIIPYEQTKIPPTRNINTEEFLDAWWKFNPTHFEAYYKDSNGVGLRMIAELRQSYPHIYRRIRRLTNQNFLYEPTVQFPI